MANRGVVGDNQAAASAPLVTRMRSLTVAKVDSIGFTVRRWVQWGAGTSHKVSSVSRCLLSLSTALGYLSPKPRVNWSMATLAS